MRKVLNSPAEILNSSEKSEKEWTFEAGKIQFL